MGGLILISETSLGQEVVLDLKFIQGKCKGKTIISKRL